MSIKKRLQKNLEKINLKKVELSKMDDLTTIANNLEQTYNELEITTIETSEKINGFAQEINDLMDQAFNKGEDASNQADEAKQFADDFRLELHDIFGASGFPQEYEELHNDIEYYREQIQLLTGIIDEDQTYYSQNIMKG